MGSEILLVQKLNALEGKVQNLQYKVALLSECIDFSQHEEYSLYLAHDWDKMLVDKIYDIFNEYQQKMEKNEKWEASDLEQDLLTHCGIDYQVVKEIIRAFYHSKKWTSLCIQFVKFRNKTAIEYDALYSEMLKNQDIKEQC